MSHASQHGPADASSGHDHDHFDGIPADEAPPDEPRTPGWFTLLGVGLVLAVLLAFALSGPKEQTRAELARKAEGATSAAPAAAPAAPSAAPRPQRPFPMAQNPQGLPSGFPMARPGTSGIRPMPRPPGAMMAPGAAPARPPQARPPQAPPPTPPAAPPH
jgi:hypothetical protein